MLPSFGYSKNRGEVRMERVLLALFMVTMLVLASGCISTKSQGVSSITPSNSTGNSTRTAVTSTFKPKLYSTQELLDRVSKIEEFTYLENTSMELHLVVHIGNLTQDKGNVTTLYRRLGYVDLKDREAAINTTATTFPGGARTFLREIIKNGQVYILIGGSWRKLTNETFGINVSGILNVTWEYNAVSFAMKYLKRSPTNVSLKNETELLYFPITERDLMAITSTLLGHRANVSVNVTNGILELRFRNGTFVGGRLGYKVEMVIRLNTPSGEAEVHETGYSYDEFVIRDINIKKPVPIPGSYRA